MVKEFNSLEEIEKYYDKDTNTYIFKENNMYIDLVIFNFNLYIRANINACNISAWDIIAYNIYARDIKAYDVNVYEILACDIKVWDIKAHNINACNINACDINACDIDAHNITANNINANDIYYYAVCFAYENILCNFIRGKRKDSKHFVLEGKLEVKNNE